MTSPGDHICSTVKYLSSLTSCPLCSRTPPLHPLSIYPSPTPLLLLLPSPSSTTPPLTLSAYPSASPLLLLPPSPPLPPSRCSPSPCRHCSTSLAGRATVLTWWPRCTSSRPRSRSQGPRQVGWKGVVGVKGEGERDWKGRFGSRVILCSFFCCALVRQCHWVELHMGNSVVSHFPVAAHSSCLLMATQSLYMAHSPRFVARESLTTTGDSGRIPSPYLLCGCCLARSSSLSSLCFLSLAISHAWQLDCCVSTMPPPL